MVDNDVEYGYSQKQTAEAIVDEMVSRNVGVGGGSGNTNPSNAATTRTATTRVLTTALVEESIALSAVKKFSIHARNNVDIRVDTIAGNTISTPNFTTIRVGSEYYESNLNFTGSLFFAVETIPTSSVPSSTTTSGSPTVAAAIGAFNGIAIGQVVTGTGIPAGTRVIARSANGSSITLSQNASAAGTVTLTFSGAVVRIESWT